MSFANDARGPGQSGDPDPRFTDAETQGQRSQGICGTRLKENQGLKSEALTPSLPRPFGEGSAPPGPRWWLLAGGTVYRTCRVSVVEGKYPEMAPLCPGNLEQASACGILPGGPCRTVERTFLLLCQLSGRNIPPNGMGWARGGLGTAKTRSPVPSVHPGCVHGELSARGVSALGARTSVLSRAQVMTAL